MENEVIEAFLLENLEESIVVIDNENEYHIGCLHFYRTDEKFLLYDNDKNIINIEKKYIKKVEELEYNSLTIDMNDGKIILEEF